MGRIDSITDIKTRTPLIRLNRNVCDQCLSFPTNNLCVSDSSFAAGGILQDIKIVVKFAPFRGNQFCLKSFLKLRKRGC